MTSPYALVGAQLIDLGYCALPVMPGTKAPGEFIGGRWGRMKSWTERYRVNHPSSSQVTSWSNLPDAGVCVLTGRTSLGLTGVDIDCDEIVEVVRGALPDTPCIKTGMKGETLLFRSNLPNTALDRDLPDGRCERLIDILSDGRQTLLPPTIHPDTLRPYRWTGLSPLEDVRPEDLPWLEDDTIETLETILRDYGYDRNKRPHSHLIATGKGPKIHVPDNYEDLESWKQVNFLAWQSPELWVEDLKLYNCVRTSFGWEAVADWRSSKKHRPLIERSRNLKINVQGRTIVDFGDGPKGYDPINLVAAQMGRERQVAWAWLARKLDWNPFPVDDPSKIYCSKSRTAPPIIKAELAPEVPMLPSPALPPSSPPWRSENDLLQVPGLVGRIQKYMVDTALYQQPQFALAAALTLVGAACARQILGPTNSSTHIYCMAVGPTASGKEHPLKCMKQVLDEAKLDRLEGPASFTSYSAVLKKLIDKPACIAIMDEVGAFLAKGKGKNAASYERQIFSLLRSMWSNAGEPFLTEARAQEADVKLYAPNMSIYGTSTVRELFESLSSTDMSNGLINRFLVFQNRVYPLPSDPIYSHKEIPRDIIDGLRAVAGRGADMCDLYHKCGDQPLAFNPHKVPWADAEVEAYYKKQRESVRVRMHNQPHLQDFMGRAIEYAVRLATIRAVGINVDDPRVTMEDFKWGEAISMQCFESLAKEAEDHMASGLKDVDNKKVRRAARSIEDRNEGWFLPRDIQQQSCARPLKSKEITDILSYFEETGELIRQDRTDERNDTKRRTYYKFIR